jgi:hypothetical protein
MLVPFAASAVTDTDTRAFNDASMYRFLQSGEDLVPILETLNATVFFGAHVKHTAWGAGNDPGMLMIVSGLGTDGGLTNRYIRVQTNKTDEGEPDNHKLNLHMTQYGSSTGADTEINSQQALDTWYAIGAQITVTQVGPIRLKAKVYQQEHGGSLLTAESTDIDRTWVNLKIFSAGQQCYDNDNSGDSVVCAHDFIGEMATPICVLNATEEDILKFMNKVHPDNLWSVGDSDYIIQPNVDTLAEKTGGIGWTTNGTLGSVGTLTLDEDGEAPVQDPTFLGITLSWIESLWLSVQTAMVPDAH